jgi:hypothetical protein
LIFEKDQRILLNMNTMAMWLATTAICLGGCSSGSAPDELWGDGRLVRVITSNLNEEQREEARVGVHFWDTVGARLRMDDEEPGPASATLQITNTKLGGLAGESCAACPIVVDLDALANLPVAYAISAVAHEAGHALGLGHVNGEAIMRAWLYPGTALTAADVQAFETVYNPPPRGH